MHVNQQKFEALRRAVGWHLRVDQLTPMKIEQIVIVYSTVFNFSWKQAYVNAYASDLEEYKEWAIRNEERLAPKLVRSKPGNPDGETRVSSPMLMNCGPT